MGRIVQGANWDPTFTFSQTPQWDISSAEVTVTVKETKDDAAAVSFKRENVAAGGGSDEVEMGPDIDQFIFHVIPANTSTLDNLDKEYHGEVLIVDGSATYKYMFTIYIEQSLTA